MTITMPELPLRTPSLSDAFFVFTMYEELYKPLVYGLAGTLPLSRPHYYGEDLSFLFDSAHINAMGSAGRYLFSSFVMSALAERSIIL